MSRLTISWIEQFICRIDYHNGTGGRNPLIAYRFSSEVDVFADI